MSHLPPDIAVFTPLLVITIELSLYCSIGYGMQIYELKKDVKVICVEATSFPGGIKNAFNRLYNQVPDTKLRNIFGISKPQNGLIIYKAAAAENFEGEATRLGLQTFVIQKGNYLGEALMDWQKNEMMIGSIFERLVADKRLDGSAHCIEWYKNERELVCLVLMRDEEINGTIQELTL